MTRKIINVHSQYSTGKTFNLALAILSITFIWSDCTNRLENNTQTLHLHYIAWACDCANWATQADIDRYRDKGNDELAKHCIFLEPANLAKELSWPILRNGTGIQVTGQFYTHKGFPQGYSSGEMPDAARVFRYSSYKVLHTNKQDDNQ